MTRPAGSTFCSEHSGDAERVPCPLDPSHTIDPKRLRAHLRKCNKARLDLSIQSKHKDIPWFRENINWNHVSSAGQEAGLEPVSNDKMVECIGLIRLIIEKEFGTDPLPLLQKRNALLEATPRYEALTNRKHAAQQSSLIQHLIESGLWPTATPIQFIELGCGRAELSRYVNIATQLDRSPVCSFLLIDRSSQRMKFDNKFHDDISTMNSPGETQKMVIRREKMDIKDLNLDPLLDRQKPCVAISKHLCGVATDLSIRCLLNSEICRENLTGVLIAMCCRHVCRPAQYANIPYIEQLLAKYNPAAKTALGYTDFFNCLRKYCSYATCGVMPGTDLHTGTDHFTKLSFEQRQQLGHMARRIIDHGRCLTFNDSPLGFHARLFRYVDRSTTLEDTALLVSRGTDHATRPYL